MTNWLKEQIKKRVDHDNKLMAKALTQMANIVSIDKLTNDFDNVKDYDNAFAEILKYFKINEEVDSVNIKDLNEKLEYLLHPYGIMKRRVKLVKGWSKNATGIMIGSINKNKNRKIVVIKPDKFGGYYINDYTSGKKIKISSKNESLINDTALCFYKPLPLKKLNAKDLIDYIFNCLTFSDYMFFIFSTLFVSLLGMAMPMVTKHLYSEVIEFSNFNMLLSLFICLFTVAISKTLIDLISKIEALNINVKICNHMEFALMMRVLSLPASDFNKYSSAELANYIWQLIEICDITLSTVLTFVFSAVFSIVYFPLIFIYTPSLFLPAFLTILLMVIFIVLAIKKQKDITESFIREDSKEGGMVYSLINGIQKIKVAGAEKRMFAKWSDQYTKASTYLYKLPPIIKFEATIVLVISLIGNIVIYYIALKDKIEVSNFMAFESAYGLISLAFMNFVTITKLVADTFATFKSVKPILDIEPEIKENKQPIKTLNGQIELNNIYFRYTESMPYIINDLSLKINKGDYVAIVGKTGCGKSTLIRILLAFEKPERGGVYFDGKDINSIDPKSLRKNIGVVLQNGKLFTGSIYENISIASENLSMDEAWEIAKIAGIYDDIKKMPMGMNTYLYEGQSNISGGQKQRILIARAIASNPKVLIFDEATSALDNITQNKISTALDKLKCTRIVIAHRLSTIKHCNKIIVLNDGKVAEVGTYKELMKKSTIFKDLVKRQTI